jgi:hypothetical protein
MCAALRFSRMSSTITRVASSDLLETEVVMLVSFGE